MELARGGKPSGAGRLLHALPLLQTLFRHRKPQLFQIVAHGYAQMLLKKAG